MKKIHSYLIIQIQLWAGQARKAEAELKIDPLKYGANHWRSYSRGRRDALISFLKYFWPMARNWKF